MRLPDLFLGLFFIPLVISKPPPVPRTDALYTIHEKRVDHPEWKRSGRVAGHIEIPFRVGLKQQNIDSLSAHLLAISDPESPSYGQHWTPAAVVKAFAPADEAVRSVHAWLVNVGGFDAERIRLSRNQAWVEVEGASVDEVERLLQTEYHVYEHESGEKEAGS